MLVLFTENVSLARGANFYWYGENNSTCWQTGSLYDPATSCDKVGPEYLNEAGSNPGGRAHVLGEASGFLHDTVASGDYCASYNLGDYLEERDNNSLAWATGVTVPEPPGSYQEGNSYGDACQAVGATWGQFVSNDVPEGNDCRDLACGIQHFVSLGSEGYNDRPWGNAFGEPSLTISTYAQPHAFAYYTNNGESQPDVGGWGYVCPILRDVTTGYALEYCFQEWRTQYNASSWTAEQVAACYNSGAEINTMFWPTTQFSTDGGDANTFVFNPSSPPGWQEFKASISEADLLAAVARVGKAYNKNAAGVNEGGCGAPLSTNPADYALVGIEEGMEAWQHFDWLGGSSADLRAYTSYSYPKSTPSPSITHWQNGYEIAFHGANGDLWTSGLDGTHDTGLGMAAGTSPSITHWQGGYEIAFHAANGDLWTSGADGTNDTGLGLAQGTSPSITAWEPGTYEGYEIAFDAANGDLWTSGLDGTKDSGLGMAAGTSPSITHWQNGYEIAFHGANGDLWTSGLDGTNDRGLGLAAYTSPAIANWTPGSTEGYEIAFHAGNGDLWTSGLDGTNDRGLALAPGSSPAIANWTPESYQGYEVAFGGANGDLWTSGLDGTSDRGLAVE